eukprot:Em0018g518a
MHRAITAKTEVVHHRCSVKLFQWEMHSDQECKVCKHFEVSGRGTLRRHTAGRGRLPGATPNMLINYLKEIAPTPVFEHHPPVSSQNNPSILEQLTCQVCPPGLHITLGIFTKLFHLLEAACHQLDLELALHITDFTGPSSSFSKYSQELQNLSFLQAELEKAQQSHEELQNMATYMALVNGEKSPLAVKLVKQSAAKMKSVKALTLTDTVLGETGDPCELFMVDECDENPLGAIMEKVNVTPPFARKHFGFLDLFITWRGVLIVPVALKAKLTVVMHALILFASLTPERLRQACIWTEKARLCGWPSVVVGNFLSCFGKRFCPLCGSPGDVQ